MSDLDTAHVMLLAVLTSVPVPVSLKSCEKSHSVATVVNLLFICSSHTVGILYDELKKQLLKQNSEDE